MRGFPHYKQLDAMDCGPTCLRMIAKYYGKSYSLQNLREKSFITREGVSLLGISDAAESIGFRTMGVRISFEQLQKEDPLPCIAHWQQRHFVVVYKIKKDFVYVSDPAYGLVKYSKKQFLDAWLSTKQAGEEKGICMLLEPSPDFYALKDDKPDKSTFTFLLKYLKPYRKLFIQLVLGMLIGLILQMILPFLTQSIVDVGISNQDIDFIYLVLFAQLILFISRMSVDFIKGWILLHISTRINISLISDFLIKLMRLPISFFDTKMIGDLMQRIGDHHRIESFLTSSTLSILFSMLNLIVFSIVMGIYSLKILSVFLIGAILYVAWISVFMKRRRDLDFKRFAQMSNNQSNIIQLITGMQEIKLNNCEKQKRWEWEQIQASLFKVSLKSLSLSQFQQAGATLINESKNILITFIAAKSVIDGNMTLGMMLAVSYILGQLNSPLEQMITFFQSAQDAKISLERLGEIHAKEDEEKDEGLSVHLPENKSITVKNASFQYEGPHSEFVLKELDMEIPEGKVTAIVGSSGSGKTTLIKVLLGFFPLTKGEVRVGDVPLQSINKKIWRSSCGAVMQDGFIFSDTITRNITMDDENIDKKRLLHAVKTANIHSFIESLPLGYNTKIGSEGHGLSQGQKQRMLIARAVYKNPEYIFLDEATNALDANNEREIINNLDAFFKGKTVIVVAHRLSTVKNADNIVVLEKGQIVEQGTHQVLTSLKGKYYELVKNQLELGV